MVEIIPKTTSRKLPSPKDALFYFSIAIFLAVVLAFFILTFYLNRAETTLSDLEGILKKEKTAEEINLEKKISGYEQKINDFSKIIDEHPLPSKLFDLIEGNSHPQVWFFEIDLNPGEKEAKLSGITDNFVFLHQQFQIFRKNPLVKNVDLVDVSIGEEGKINFNFNFDLAPGLFK